MGAPAVRRGRRAVGGAAMALGAATALAGGAQTQIVDAHVHLWDNTRLRVPWIDANPVLNRPYLPADYTEHTAGTGTEALVYVEVAVAPPYVALEPDWVLARARLDPRIQGMVVWAPVEFGELSRAYLEAMVAKGPLVKGVRRGLGNDPALASSADFVRGVQLLGEHGLSFDLLGRGEPVMGAAIELVRRCPGTQFMVDHLFNPDVRQGTLDPWRAQLAARGVPQRLLQGQRGGDQRRPGALAAGGPGAVRRPRPGGVRRGPRGVRQRLAGDPAGRDDPALGGRPGRHRLPPLARREAQAVRGERQALLPPRQRLTALGSA